MKTIHVYQAKDGWRWRLTASNGRKIAASGEAFASHRNARRAAMGIWKALIQPVLFRGS